MGDGDMRWELKTEDFSVVKRSTTNGVARLRKYVVLEDKSAPVRVCRDELVVDRHSASGDASAPFWAGESYVEIPLITEVAVPVLTPRIYEVVRVRKVTICETNSVGGVTRTEKLEVIR